MQNKDFTKSNNNNILIFIDWFLPGTNSGGPVRSVANMVDHLKEFNFYIITRNTDYCSTEAYANIEPNQWIQHTENVRVYYFSEEQLSKAKLQEVIESVDSDIIYINGIYSKFFSIAPLQIAMHSRLNTIVAARGMLSPHALAVKAFKKNLFLSLMNAKNTYKKVVFHATNEQEQKDIDRVIKRYTETKVIPNFPRKIETAEHQPIEKKEGQVRLISLGRIAEEKGTLVSLEALKGCKGEATLDLYGTIYNQSYWDKCKAVIKTLPENISVDYKGTLRSDHVMHTLSQYHFLLLPSKGENYGHSIVESFMANRPVIISKNTPWKNLEEKNIGYDVEESELSNTIQQVIAINEEKYNKKCEAISDQIEKLLKVDKLKEKYKKLFSGNSKQAQ
ncbi:MAG: glycosyltransferase [Brumimicrobium sp.]|nr:glycosyltransferase [Brumimicrobium sp.]